jgi:hypothetical protein
MNREEASGDPCAGQFERAQDAPQEDRRAGVEEYVDEVISARVQLPELVLEPEAGEPTGITGVAAGST